MQSYFQNLKHFEAVFQMFCRALSFQPVLEKEIANVSKPCEIPNYNLIYQFFIIVATLIKAYLPTENFQSD